MTQMSEPIIEDYEGKGFTKITFTPDFKLFGVSNLPTDMINLLKRRVYDMAGLLRIGVYLNNKIIRVADFKSYVDLYLDEDSKVIAEV
jgi:DNA topoisomerase II